MAKGSWTLRGKGAWQGWISSPAMQFPFKNYNSPAYLAVEAIAFDFLSSSRWQGIVLPFLWLFVLCLFTLAFIKIYFEGQQIYCQARWIVHFNNTFQSCGNEVISGEEPELEQWRWPGMLYALLSRVSHRSNQWLLFFCVHLESCLMLLMWGFL